MKKVKLTKREITVMSEAFTTGRVYAHLGEKEDPIEIWEKLIENCKNAVLRMKGKER